MQYVQNLSQPYIILTNDLYLFSLLTGRFSTISPSLENTSIISSFFSIALDKSIGKLWILCVPNTKFIHLYLFSISFTTDSSWAMQPHRIVIISGLVIFKCFILPSIPNTLLCAFSLIAHVLRSIRSASSILSV